MRLPPALPEPSQQDVLLAQGGDRAARDRVYNQRSRFRKRERERERILAEQQDGSQGGDGAAALQHPAAQGDDALPDDARGAGDADDSGFEEDGGFGDGGFDDDDEDTVEQVCAQRGVRGVRWHWLTITCVLCAQSQVLGARCKSPSFHPSSSSLPPKAMDREDTWAQVADVAPRACMCIVWYIIIITSAFCVSVVFYKAFVEGKSLQYSFPIVPLGSTPSSNTVKSEY